MFCGAANGYSKTREPQAERRRERALFTSFETASSFSITNISPNAHKSLKTSIREPSILLMEDIDADTCVGFALPSRHNPAQHDAFD
jgi:hypothetical protein